MTTSSAASTSAHKEQTVRRELRNLVRAAKLLQSPTVVAPANLSPWHPADPRAVKLASVWKSQAALSLAAASMRRLRERAPEVRPRLTSLTSTNNVLYAAKALQSDRVFDRSPDAVVTLTEQLLRYFPGVSARLVSMAAMMTPTDVFMSYGVRTWREMEDLFFRWASDLERDAVPSAQLADVLKDSVPDVHLAKDEKPGGIICVTNAKTGERECRPINSEDARNIAIILAVVGLLGWLGSKFNETDDDAARKEIDGLACDGIVNKSDSLWVDSFKAMIAGPTGDEDEIAMLKVLGCLPCDRVAKLVTAVKLDTLDYNFDGEEWDKLMIRLQECSLVDFSTWDDDATRLFISNTPPFKLASLTVGNIVTLCWNLIKGSCGDSDEAAIIQLLSAQHPCKIQDIVKNHISIDDFDSGVDGAEWDILVQLIIAALPTPCG